MRDTNLASKDKVSANIKLDSESHRKLRLLSNKTGLTNSEVICGLLSEVDVAKAEQALKSAIQKKRQDKEARRTLRQEVEALSPERVKELLALIKK